MLNDTASSTCVPASPYPAFGTLLSDKLTLRKSGRLVPTLQHSILGLWLTATQAGISPACL